MKAAHTPGPWAFMPDTGEVCSVALGTGYATICDPSAGRQEATGRLLPIDERQANGRAIAAVPKMLAALNLVNLMAAGVDRRPEYEAVREALAAAGVQP